MPQFVNNLNNLVLDDQYFMELNVPASSPQVPTGNIGLVGTFSRGALNTPTLVTSYTDLVKKFGEVDSAFALTGTITARGIFAQGNANVYVVRISGTTAATQASAAILDTSATPQTVFTLQAATPGTWGNSLQAVVTPGTKSGTYKMSLSYGNESEVWDNLIISQPATPITGAVLASTVFGANGLSALATATFPATPVTTTWATGTGGAGATYTLSGGTNGESTIASDYTGTTSPKTGINALDSSPVNLVLCAEQSDASVNSALISNAQSITQNGGTPRVAVITFPKGTAVSGLATLTSNMDTDRAIAVYPWLNVFDPITNHNQTVSPLGYFAGVLAQLSPQLSPGNKRVLGILGIDPNMNIGPSDLVTMVQDRINAIGVQTPAGHLGIRTGHTLSQSTDTAPIYVRRMKDFIDTSVNQVAGIYVDEPITSDLMRQVKQAVENILYPMKNPTNPSDLMVADYQVICDTTNNTPDVTAANRLVCDYKAKLLNMNRFEIFRTQIGSGVVISANS